MPRARGRPTETEALLVAKDPFIKERQDSCLAARRAGTADERSRSAEDAFFRAAAALEAFLSEWVIRCVSFDSTKLRGTYEAKAANEAQSLLWREWEPSSRLWTSTSQPTINVSIALSKKHALEQTVRLLGRDDDNLSFTGAAAFKQTANELLIEKYAKRARTLAQRNDRVLDATIAIRNVIAHRSQRALTRMNQCLGSTHLPQGLRRMTAVSSSGVGYYLRTEGTAGRPRFEVFFDELAEIAHILARKPGPRPVICP